MQGLLGESEKDSEPTEPTLNIDWKTVKIEGNKIKIELSPEAFSTYTHTTSGGYVTTVSSTPLVFGVDSSPTPPPCSACDCSHDSHLNDLGNYVPCRSCDYCEEYWVDEDEYEEDDDEEAPF